MRTEILIYCYGSICLCMLVFHVVCIFVFRSSASRLEKKSSYFSSFIHQQTERLQVRKPVTEEHLRFLERKLLRVSKLRAFAQALGELEKESTELFKAYLVEIEPVFLRLSQSYVRRENIQAAYFVYLLSRYMPWSTAREELARETLKYVRRDSLYCRQNALKALYRFGTPENVTEAVKIIDGSKGFFHEKILTEGLLSYEGDHERLIALLWEAFDGLSNGTRHSVLNYIRFQTGDYQKEMYQILESPDMDKELKLAAVRYFGKYPYEPARRRLIQMVQDRRPEYWEYAAVAASSLAVYQGEETVDALKEALCSANWYVRYNASASLDIRTLDYEDLIEAVNGKDRYAREMMMYRLESRRLREGEQK